VFLLKTAITTFILIFLTACSSIPLTSMILLSNFDVQDFSKTVPEELQARLTINDPAQLRLDDVRLVFKFEYDFDAPQEFQFLLTPQKQSSIAKQSHWYGSSPKRHQYDFNLAEKSISEFERYQQQLLHRGKPNNFKWTVYYYLTQDLPSGYAIDLDLAIKFSKENDYLMILKGASIDID